MPEFDTNNERQRTTSAHEASEKEQGERALSTLKAIAQGYGEDPRIYARNTLDSIGVRY